MICVVYDLARERKAKISFLSQNPSFGAPKLKFYFLLADFTDKLFQDGLEHSDMESMITGLLLVRQACFHGPHVFMSYADWFQVKYYMGSVLLT